jgi:hypothetical protein
MEKMKFQLKLGDGNDIEYITYLGGGKAGIVHSYPAKLTVVDIHSGSVLWERKEAETYGGVAVPIYDERAVYIPLNSSSRAMSAHNPATGEELWKRSLSSSTYQYMVPLAQTEAHIASCNTNAKVLSVLDKKTGKIVCKAKLKHEVPDYRPWVFAWQDKFIAIGLDKRTDQFVLDLYNPSVEGGYVDVVARFPEKGKVERIGESQLLVVGNFLYFFSELGWFYKLNLLTGQIESKHHPLDGAKGKYYFNKRIAVEGNLLCCVVEHSEGDVSKFYMCRYNLNADTFTAVTFELKLERIYHGNILPICGGAGIHMNENGIVKYDLLGDCSSKEIPLENWAAHFGKDLPSMHTGEQDEKWLIVDDKLLYMRDKPRSERKAGKVLEDAGCLFCWEI